MAVAVPTLREARLASFAGEWPRSFMYAPDVVVAVPLESEAGIAVRASERRASLVHRRPVRAQMGTREEACPADGARERPGPSVRDPLVPSKKRA